MVTSLLLVSHYFLLSSIYVSCTNLLTDRSCPRTEHLCLLSFLFLNPLLQDQTLFFIHIISRIICFILLLLFSHSVVSSSLRPHALQHTRLPCPSPSPGACSLSRWCHPTILSSVIPFSSCLHYFPASGSFLMSQFFTSGGQSIGAAVSVSPWELLLYYWIWVALLCRMTL